VVSAAGAPKFCPTPAVDLVRIVSGMLDQLDCDVHCWGTYHYHSSDAASCYEFAEVVLAAAAQ
jgi:dTDP-4-dehydrorhamnose reductase